MSESGGKTEPEQSSVDPTGESPSLGARIGLAVAASLLVYPGVGHLTNRRWKTGAAFAALFTLVTCLLLGEGYLFLIPLADGYGFSLPRPPVPLSPSLSRLLGWAGLTAALWAGSAAHVAYLLAREPKRG